MVVSVSSCERSSSTVDVSGQSVTVTSNGIDGTRSSLSSDNVREGEN